MSAFDREQREMEQAERWLRRFETPPAPAGLHASIRSAVRAELAHQAPRRSWSLPRWSGAIAAAAALALTAGLVMRFGGSARMHRDHLQSVEQFVEAFDALQRDGEGAELALLSNEIEDFRLGGDEGSESGFDVLSESLDQAMNEFSSSL